MKTLAVVLFITINVLQAQDNAEAFRRRYGPAPKVQPAPAPSGSVQVRFPNKPDTTREEKFPVLIVKGKSFTNAILRAFNWTEGAVHHDGGIEKIKLEDLPEPVRARFYQPDKAEQEALERQRRQGAAQQNQIARNKQLRAAFIREKHPLKVIDGKLYDFTPAHVAFSLDPSASGFSKFRVIGRVVQVVTDGLIVHDEKLDLNIHLRNYSRAGSVFDGAVINTFAHTVGRYQYINTQGATMTVVDKDCGRVYDPQNDRFEQKILVKPYEDEIVQVSDLDKAMP